MRHTSRRRTSRKRAPVRRAAGVTLLSEQTGRVLLIRRSSLVPKPGLWSIPAGRIEPRESALQGALRELEEETGFRGNLLILDCVSTQRFDNFLALIPREFRPRLNWENDMAGWFAPTHQPQPLHPGLHRLLLRLAARSN